MPLLRPDEPPAFEVINPDAASRWVLTCDHASARLPAALGDLGVSASERERHIAWDIGIAGVARRLSPLLDGFLILAGYSRLAIDLNRPLSSPQSMVTLSEHTAIPGNHGLSPADAAARAEALFHPYHDRIRAELDRRQAAGRASVLISLHSFTPVFKGERRSVHTGMLYNRDPRLGRAMIDVLRADPALVVGDNQPYSVSDDSDYTVVVHGERRGLPHVEVEVRQDLIADAAGQAAWATRLASALEQAHARIASAP